MTRRNHRTFVRRSLGAKGTLLALTILVGCDRLDMYDQPRYKPLAASAFFADGMSARPRVEGTVAQGELQDDEPLYTGKEAGKPASRIPRAVYSAIYQRDSRAFDQPFDETEPVELRRALMERGRGGFDIHCSVCHSRDGDGDGMIVQRGFRRPPALYIDRLRDAPNGYFFDVITHGFGAMPSYASRIDAVDRWAIVAYVRALQFRQNARLSEVPDDERRLLPAAAAQPAEVQP